MTIQNIYNSDYYGAVRFTESKDNGITWSEPISVPSFGRRHEIPLKASIKNAVSDVASVYHAKTNTNILIGEVIYYDAGKKANPMPPRYPVYTVRDKHGKWHGKKRLVWKDPRGSSVYSAGSAQIDVQPNGDLLIPISFRPLGKLAFSVATLLCSFDGKTIRVKKVSNELSYNVDRGFLEPQIVKHGDMYYMTIRAEDGRGYVSTSTNGLSWSKPVPWAWTNSTIIDMSTTQQHWMSHGDNLYLVYTRKDKSNINVVRWRAPLYLAKVNKSMLALEKQTERVVFKLIGDGVNDPKHVPHYGNFHVDNVNPIESWITVGELIPANFRGDTLMARIKW